jgi:SWIM/SEC-C metal-binding protein
VSSIGTHKHPAIARVQTVERAQQVIDFCKEHGIQAIVGVEPDKTEDISDVERAMVARQPKALTPKVGRNDPCPCGSGHKFKKCCEGRAPPTAS